VRRYHLYGVLALFVAVRANAQDRSAITSEVEAVYGQSEVLYRYLHQHPELSSKEAQTAIKIAGELRQLGFDVTTGVGGTGVVALLRNGPGPTVMLRTELDALPVTENTGLAFASTVVVKNDAGVDVGVSHACGHDIHMASLVGTARIMAADRTRWSGTLMLIAQPAEETVAGARGMLNDGLFTRFPRPDYALAVHDDARFPAGLVGYHAGPILTNADGVIITIYGRGGHGARPESAIDPIVIAARLVVSLQTIVSRENSPFDPAVVTVGTIHGGTKNNIIPDEVKLELTVRSFTPAVRQRLLAAIDRITKAEAAAAAAPRAPKVEVIPGASALVNDPALTERVRAALVRSMAPGLVTEIPPEMASEDFSEFQLAGIPTVMLRVGAVERVKYDAAMKGGGILPSLHSALYAPDREPTMKSAIAAEVVALRDLMPPASKRPAQQQDK